MGKGGRGRFVFRKADSVGAADAKHDPYLKECFYDSGDLSTLLDCSSLRRIVIGRTGVGKTALLLKLAEEEERTRILDPENLSLQFLCNSTILTHLAALNVNLDLFHKLLWKHILTVELLQMKFGLRSEQEKETLFTRLRQIVVRDKKREKAIHYLEEWGKSFWKDTEYRVREVTKKLETDVRARLGAKATVLDAGVDGQRSMSIEEKASITQLAQEVVNQLQLNDLNEVVHLLQQEYFQEEPPKFFLVLDRLDENWVDDSIRFRLIRALLETVKDFTVFKPVKIVVALRTDLLNRVFRVTRGPGFQEEKFRDFCLPLRWSDKQLFELLGARVRKLVRRQYEKSDVRWEELLPDKIDNIPIAQYLTSRTLGRPRDIVEFFNCCIEEAESQATISAAILRKAEARYSDFRFRSLVDEWGGEYPALQEYAQLLKGRPPHFRIGEIQRDTIETVALAVSTANSLKNDLLAGRATDVVEGRLNAFDFLFHIFRLLYDVGMVGLKTEAVQRVRWSFRDEIVIDAAEINKLTLVHISPVFHRVLGTNPQLAG